MKKIVSLGALFTSILASTVASFAGDKSLLSNIANSGIEKPNTGDTNMILVYGGIIAVVAILLVVINLKGSKKNTSENANESLENKDSNTIENNNDNNNDK